MYDVQKDLTYYFHPKNKAIASVMLLFSADMTAVFVTHHVLKCRVGQCDICSHFHAAHGRPERFTNGQHRTYSRSPGSQSSCDPHLLQRRRASPVCGLNPTPTARQTHRFLPAIGRNTGTSGGSWEAPGNKGRAGSLGMSSNISKNEL